MHCYPTPQQLANEDRITYRIVTDGQGLFLLPYSEWLLPPYATCHWITYDPIAHGQLAFIGKRILQRGEGQRKD